MYIVTEHGYIHVYIAHAQWLGLKHALKHFNQCIITNMQTSLHKEYIYIHSQSNNVVMDVPEVKVSQCQ